MKIGNYDLKYYKLTHYKKIIARKFIKGVHTKPLFVVGNQRSGTTMLLSKLNRHFWVDIFHEDSSAMQDWELKSFDEIDKLINGSKAKVCIMKPLEETHRINELLDYFNGSKAIFMFRKYTDVINSSMRLAWGKHLKKYVQNIDKGVDFKYSGALNLTTDNIKLIRDLYKDDLSDESCCALIWYLRNSIYFEFQLYANPNILLVQYESLVSNPKSEFKRILTFMGLKWNNSIFYNISTKSITKDPAVNIDVNIKVQCDNLLAKLEERVKSCSVK